MVSCGRKDHLCKEDLFKNYMKLHLHFSLFVFQRRSSFSGSRFCFLQNSQFSLENFRSLIKCNDSNIIILLSRSCF